MEGFDDLGWNHISANGRVEKNLMHYSRLPDESFAAWRVPLNKGISDTAKSTLTMIVQLNDEDVDALSLFLI